MRKPKTLRRVRYTVRGRGFFPFDMLRYDHSEPCMDEDYKWIGPLGTYTPKHLDPIARNFPHGEPRRDERELMLVAWLRPDIRAGAIKEGLIPCVDRWASFGWTVTEVYNVEKFNFDDVPVRVTQGMGY